MFQPFPKKQILDSFKLKEFADDNFKFDENDRKFSRRVENTVGKGEIACYEQFLCFPQCFKRLVLQIRKNQGLFGKWLNQSHFAINEKIYDYKNFYFCQNIPDEQYMTEGIEIYTYIQKNDEIMFIDV